MLKTQWFQWLEVPVTKWISKTLQIMWVKNAVTKWMLKTQWFLWLELTASKWILKILWLLWAENAAIYVSWKRLRQRTFRRASQRPTTVLDFGRVDISQWKIRPHPCQLCCCGKKSKKIKTTKTQTKWKHKRV